MLVCVQRHKLDRHVSQNIEFLHKYYSPAPRAWKLSIYHAVVAEILCRPSRKIMGNIYALRLRPRESWFEDLLTALQLWFVMQNMSRINIQFVCQCVASPCIWSHDIIPLQSSSRLRSLRPPLICLPQIWKRLIICLWNSPRIFMRIFFSTLHQILVDV